MRALKRTTRVVSSVVEQLAFNQLVEGSNPSRPTTYGPLAQLVEQLTLNQLVKGSSPLRPTRFFFDYNLLVEVPRR